MAQTTHNKPINPTAVMVVILLAGATLRFHGLTIQSLWNDELAMWVNTHVSSMAAVLATLPADHPPAYRLFIHSWLQFFPATEFWLRLPSAYFGLLTISAMFILGRRLFSVREGLIAAGLTAVLWASLYYSQEARANMALMLMVTLSVYWLLDIGRALRTNTSLPKTAVAGYVLTAAAAAYIHYFGLYFVTLQALFIGLCFLRQPSAWPRLLLVYVLVGLAYLPWLPSAFTAVTTGSPTWIQTPTLGSIWDFLRFTFHQSNAVIFLSLFLWGFLLVRRLPQLRQHPQTVLLSSESLLLLWFVVPFALIYIKSLVSSPVVVSRNFIILLPAANLLLARAITQLPKARWSAPLVTGVLFPILLFHLLYMQQYYTAAHKTQFRDVVAYLVAHDTPQNNALIIGHVWQLDYLDFYLARQDSPRRAHLRAGEVADAPAIWAQIGQQQPDDIWFITAERPPNPAFVGLLKENLQLVDEAHFVRAHVWHFIPATDNPEFMEDDAP